MKTIWKFPLEVKERQTVKMPLEANILHVDQQDNIPCVWAEVNPGNENEEITFEIFGTGHPLPELPDDKMRIHIGSILLFRGSLVYHIYEYFSTVL